MRFVLAAFFVLIFTQSGLANHLKGGWIQYQYISSDPVNQTTTYDITVRQYLSCNSTAGQRDQFVYLGIFDNATNTLYSGQAYTVPLSGSDNPNKTTYSPCISSPPPVCYFIDRYTKRVVLPNNTAGYTLTVQRCCRIAAVSYTHLTLPTKRIV